MQYTSYKEKITYSDKEDYGHTKLQYITYNTNNVMSSNDLNQDIVKMNRV